MQLTPSYRRRFDDPATTIVTEVLETDNHRVAPRAASVPACIAAPPRTAAMAAPVRRSCRINVGAADAAALGTFTK